MSCGGRAYRHEIHPSKPAVVVEQVEEPAVIAGDREVGAGAAYPPHVTPAIRGHADIAMVLLDLRLAEPDCHEITAAVKAIGVVGEELLVDVALLLHLVLVHMRARGQEPHAVPGRSAPQGFARVREREELPTDGGDDVGRTVAQCLGHGGGECRLQLRHRRGVCLLPHGRRGRRRRGKRWF
eukprot:scaffold161019_cov35-Tisochrysis_lutea.AAC.1